MTTVKLRYIGPLAHVDVPILQRQGEPYDEHGAGCLVHGEEFDCDTSIAGRAPTVAADGTITDYGEGLLAQPTNYEQVGAPAKKPAKPRKTVDPPPAKPPIPAASPAVPTDTVDDEEAGQ